jgi:hypothetical protein
LADITRRPEVLSVSKEFAERAMPPMASAAERDRFAATPVSILLAGE